MRSLGLAAAGAVSLILLGGCMAETKTWGDRVRGLGAIGQPVDAAGVQGIIDQQPYPSFTYVTDLAADTDLTITTASPLAYFGDLQVFRITSSGVSRTVSWDPKFKGAVPVVTSGVAGEVVRVVFLVEESDTYVEISRTGSLPS